jgi:hypothetical protein
MGNEFVGGNSMREFVAFGCDMMLADLSLLAVMLLFASQWECNVTQINSMCFRFSFFVKIPLSF